MNHHDFNAGLDHVRIITETEFCANEAEAYYDGIDIRDTAEYWLMCNDPSYPARIHNRQDHNSYWSPTLQVFVNLS